METKQLLFICSFLLLKSDRYLTFVHQFYCSFVRQIYLKTRITTIMHSTLFRHEKKGSKSQTCCLIINNHLTKKW